MKLSLSLWQSSSIATRLTWRVIGTMTLLLTLVLGLIFIIIWAAGFALLSGLYLMSVDLTNEKINNIFSAVEVAVTNNVPEVEENIENEHRQYYAVENLLRLNPNIIGSAVALNPEYEPYKGVKSAPYVYRDSSGIKTLQLNSPDYDYQNKDWYLRPIEQLKGGWSDPYFDKGGGNIPMVTYSLPLTNNHGEVYAVHTADISLEWIANLTHRMDSIFNADYDFSIMDDDSVGHVYSFIVTHDGTFVSHPNKELVMNTKYQDYYKNIKRNLVLEKNEEAISGFKDSLGQKYFLFYKPIKNTGWTLAVVVPQDDVVEPVNIILMMLGAIIIIGLIIVAAVCRRSIRNITNPIRQFADSADEIAKGNIQAELPMIKTHDEMLRLHSSFEMMQSSLVRQIKETQEINEEKGRIEGELLAARNIQMSMLPKIFPPYPNRNDIDIYAQLTPAKEVGGDLFDFFIRDEKLMFCIGDVSGKGIPSSLVMAVTRSLFRSISAHVSKPSRIMAAINDTMAEGNESEMFVTLFIGVLDLPTGRLRYCNAGHNAPLLSGPEGIDWLPCDANLPIGIMGEWKYTSQEIQIVPQTLLFLFTDGLNEAENSNHQQFQEQRILEVARQSQLQPKTLINEMTMEVHKFVDNAEQSDDLTMMAILYCKEQKAIRLQRTLTLTNNIDEVPQLSAFIEEVCEALSIDMTVAMQMNLAMEEAVVNVMSYAYPKGITGQVSIMAKASDEQLQFIITDTGIPFDPTQKDSADTTLSVEERPIGGLGIHLIRQIMDSINYERFDGKNILTLSKKLDTPLTQI